MRRSGLQVIRKTGYWILETSNTLSAERTCGTYKIVVDVGHDIAVSDVAIDVAIDRLHSVNYRSGLYKGVYHTPIAPISWQHASLNPGIAPRGDAVIPETSILMSRK